MAVAVREKLGQPGVRFENWEFEMKALLRQHGLGAVIRAPVGLEGNSRLGSVSAAAASPARPVGVATPAISPAAAVAAAATAAVAASLTPEQDEKAHAIICSSVDPTKYRALCNRHESAKGLWQALRNMHTQQVHASRQQLIIQAGRQSMQSGQSVQEYWAEAQDLHERINSTGAYSDTLCQALLGLPPDYQQLVQSILEQPLDEQLTFEQILPRLLLREQLLQNSQPHAVALAARSARGRDSSSPSRHPGSMSRSSIAYSVVSKPLLFGEWVIDSGCSRHLTPHRELLHDYQPLHEPHHIIVANGSRIEAQGQGVVCFEGAGGAMQLLDVLHVPEADGSLVSHSIRGTQVEQDLFLLDSKPVPVAGGFCLAARTCSDPLVLHHRLGHPGYRQLARLLREGMVRGTSVTAAQCEAAASELCEPCVMGKQTSLEARQHAGLGVTATRPLMLVHSDVCDVAGQYSAATPDGMRYFVSLLDEFSGLVAVVLIKHKSDAPAALRDMVTLLQRRLGHKVVYLRTDRGGEYIGAETQQWLRSEGITHQQTAPRTPTMNGSAERVNRTIMECVRAMMLASGVPAYFWGFGVMAAAHVHNLRPVAGKPCTPHEACFGSPTDIHHLRVWGCPAWVHDSEPSNKLASRGIKGVFVGYEEGGKAYQVWAEGRLYVSKSVVFDEQAVLRRFAPVPCAPAPSDLVAPPSAVAPKGGGSAAGEQPGEQGGMEQGRMGSGGGTPAVTPTVTPARHSANRGGGSSDSNSGGGGQAGSRGGPPAAPDSSGGDGVGAGWASLGGADGLGSSGGMETGTPDTVPALRPALVPPERRRSERVRKRVEFPDFVTLCYSARYESNISSGSEREGDGSRGSRGSSGGAASQPAGPRSFSEAMSRPDAEEWGRAMDAEMASQHANQTWVLVSRQPGMSVLPGRWVLKVKWGSDGSIVKYKARWVVKGFRQRDGVDYFEDAVFAPVVMHTTQRLIFALAVQRGWGLWQIDFKTAFLNSKLTDSDPQIFVEQPEGYEVGKGLVCQLQRTVYGLKQAPRAWYMCLREQLEQIGFRASAADPSLFSLRTSSGSAVHMLVYVDDCILASADEAAVQEVKQQLQQAFDVHDLGQAADFLGMRIAFDRAAGILRLTQQQYIEQLLQRFGLAECNPRQLPLSPGTQLVKEGEQLSEQHTLRYRELVGGLLWLSTCTRPDIAFAVGQLTRYMQAPTREHEQAAQGVLRYLRGTAGQGLVFRGSCSGELVGFCDSDYASCKQSRRNTTGYVFILSGATVSVRSKLQTTVATSTTEAEYQAAADATREALFLRKLLHELCAVTGPVPILCDSQGAVALVKNPVESQRSKHIAVMHHMARERVWRGEVEFSYCPTADMVADALTKALPGPKFVSCKAGMGAMDLLKNVLQTLNAMTSAQPPATTAPPTSLAPGVGPLSYAGALTAAPILPETGTSAAAAQADEIQRLRQQLVGATANLQASQNEAVRVRAELAEMERLQSLQNSVVGGEPAIAAIRNQYSQSARPAVNVSSGTSAALVAPVAPALSGTATPAAPTAPPAAPAGQLSLSQVAAPVTVPASLPRIKVPGPDKWTDQCLATSRVAEIFCEDLEVHCAYLRIDPADALPNFLSGKAREVWYPATRNAHILAHGTRPTWAYLRTSFKEMAGDDLRNESDMHRRRLLDPGALRMSAGSTLNAYITEFRNTLTVAGATCMAPSMLVATFIRGLTPDLQSRVVHDLALMIEPTLNDAIQAAVNAQKVLFAVATNQVGRRPPAPVAAFVPRKQMDRIRGFTAPAGGYPPAAPRGPYWDVSSSSSSGHRGSRHSSQGGGRPPRPPPPAAPVSDAPPRPPPGHACHHCWNPAHFRDYCNLKHL
ncbi:hypothetical protein QJQ45_003113 [Haematococcus lacustris]|nr:hypothetical protein QJQ45_003113 [Haematococcus lacustris]